MFGLKHQLAAELTGLSIEWRGHWADNLKLFILGQQGCKRIKKIVSI